MPTDIDKVLIGAQAVIDKTVETIAATTETQRVLNLNINATDQKIGTHNGSDKSHEDLRVMLADQPAMITDPVVTGPSAVETGEENIWIFSAASIMPTVSLSSFSVTDNKGNKYNVPADADGRGTFTHTFTGTNGENIDLMVRALGSFKFASKDVKFSVLITKHSPPDLSTLTHTIPSRVSYGKSYPFKISGITDVDGDLTAVDILFDDTKLQFTQAIGITQGLEYQLSVPNDVKGPGTTNVTIRATDARGLTNSHVIPVTINSDPVLTGLAHTIPTVILKDSSVTCRVSGVVDPEGDNITFSISSSNPGISFSKLDGIGLNEDFVITALNSVTETACQFTLVFRDAYGGSASTTVTSKINFPPSVQNMKIVQPERYVPGQNVKLTISGAVDAEGGLTSYAIENTHPELSFSKTVGIADSEQIDVSVSALAQRGALLPITVKATDKYGSYTPVNASVAINTPPNLSGLTTDIPARSIPGKTYSWHISGITDAESQPLTYSVTSSNADVILTDATNRSSGQAFQCTIPTEDKLPRGESFILTLTVSDGLETTEKVFTITQNRAIDMSNFAHTMPQRFIPGQTVAFHMYGASDPDGEPLVYSIVSRDATVCSFSKYTPIAENEWLNLIVKSDAQRGLASQVTFRVTDSAGEFAEKVVDCKVNSLPNITGFTHDIPGILKPDTTYDNLTVSGLNDAETDNLKISISATNGVTVNQGTAISQGDLFSIVTPSVATLGRGGSFMLTFDITDGFETVSVSKTFKINTLPDLQNFSISLAAKLKPNAGYPGITFTSITDSDAQNLKYSFVASNGVTITGGDNISAGDVFAVSTPTEDVLARGASFTITASVSDGVETVTKVLPFVIRNLPDLTNFATTIPSSIVPGATVTGLTVSGATSPDSLPLLYSVGSSNPDVILTGALAISAGTQFSLTSPVEANLARGASFQLSISVSDGTEVVTVTKTVTQNSLPDATGVTTTMPASMKGGIENAPQFTISGGSDADNSNFRYSIENIVGQLTFSKLAGILVGEIVTVSSPKVASSTACSFDVFVMDSAGEKSTTSVHVATSVDPIMVTAEPTIIYPVDGDNYVPNTGFTLTFSEYAAVPWMGDGVYPNKV